MGVEIDEKENFELRMLLNFKELYMDLKRKILKLCRLLSVQ